MSSAYFNTTNKLGNAKALLGLFKDSPSQNSASAGSANFKYMTIALIIGIGIFIGGYYSYLYMRDGRENLLTGHYKIAYSQFISRAEKGEPTAQNIIANLYLLGLGVKRDQLVAARWYLKSAMQGSIAAQLNLGQMYWNGQGLPARPLKALGWFVLAKNSGSQRADGHIRYMIQANSILPNMIEAAKNDYKELAIVKKRYVTLGENDFLLK